MFLFSEFSEFYRSPDLDKNIKNVFFLIHPIGIATNADRKIYQLKIVEMADFFAFKKKIFLRFIAIPYLQTLFFIIWYKQYVKVI